MSEIPREYLDAASMVMWGQDIPFEVALERVIRIASRGQFEYSMAAFILYYFERTPQYSYGLHE